MILVLGAAGMIGHQVWKKLAELYPEQVFGTLKQPVSKYSQFNLFDESKMISGLNVMDYPSVESVLNKIKPQWVINCIGITLRQAEAGDLEKCIELNSMLPHRLEKWAQNNQAKVIHFSTDCVFDGQKGNYKEEDTPTSKDIYGKTKYLGEIDGVNALTLRLSFFGRELEKKTEIVEWLLAQKGKKVKGYANAFYSGVSTIRVANEVAKIIQKHPRLHGLYHLSSKPISKYDLLILLNEAFNTHVEIEKFENAKNDKSLNSSAYSKETSFTPPEWKEMIQELATDTSVRYERY
ncbi:MAG: SDR family oxidoreductase [Bdellovibrionota bacterium]